MCGNSTVHKNEYTGVRQKVRTSVDAHGSQECLLGSELGSTLQNFQFPLLQPVYRVWAGREIQALQFLSKHHKCKNTI